MASSNKIIVVVGATGNQGSSVAKTFLNLPNWHVRCLTRNPSSDAAQALTVLGAEVVKGDLSDITSLSRAFENANAIFLNTDFWETYRGTESQRKGDSEASFAQEVSHGKNAAIAAAGVKSLERFVYSALGPMKRTSKGKYPHSYHWESKAAIVDYIEEEQPELAKKASFIYLGAYTTNAFLVPQLDPGSGKYTFVLPMKRNSRMPIIDPSSSTGPFVRALIENEEPGKKLLAYDSYLTIGEVVNVWSKASGKDAVLQEVTIDYMNKKLGVPIEVLDGVGYVEEFGYMAGLESIEPDQLTIKVETKSFEEWLKGRNWEEILGDAKAEFESIKE